MEQRFGQFQGLALELDAARLEAGYDAGQDVNDTYGAAVDAIGLELGFTSYWQGDGGSFLYFYGPSYDAMAAALAPVLANDPLCVGAKVFQIA